MTTLLLATSCPAAVATRAPARARASAAVASPRGVASCSATATASSRVVLARQLRSGFAAAAAARAAPAPRLRGRAGVRCQAASASSEGSKPSSVMDTAYLGFLFGLWYAANILFNIWNKQVLKAYTFPVTGTFVQFGVGLCIACAMWLLRIKKAPKVSAEVIKGVLPLAVVHTLGNLLTNVSLGAVSVSFTHTIKAMEPFFSVLLSWAFLGSVPSAAMLATLAPIVGGVALASFSEPTFNWGGFAAAMGSNLTFQSRNVLSKKLMGGKSLKNAEAGLDNINLFSLITIASFFLTIPVVLLAEGVRFTPAAMAAAGVDPTLVMQRTLAAGLMFHGYQQVSYMILSKVSPVTHSVGNCVKRVVVIVSSVLFFRTPVSPVNAVGTAIALAGVFLYSRVTSKKGGKSE